MQARPPLLALKTLGTESTFISILENQPFYRVTNTSPKFVGTFFPFGGMRSNPVAVILPTIDHQDYPEDVRTLILSSFGEATGEQLMRFAGNFKFLIVSMLFGGGIWEQPAAEKLKQHVQNFYRRYIASIEKKYGDQIKFIKGGQESAVEVSEAKQINRTLAQYESNKSATKPFELLANDLPFIMSYKLNSANEDGHLHPSLHTDRKNLVGFLLAWLKRDPTNLSIKKWLRDLGYNFLRVFNVIQFEYALEESDLQPLLADDCFLPLFSKENYDAQMSAVKMAFLKNWDELIKNASEDQIEFFEKIKKALSDIQSQRVTGFSSQPQLKAQGGVVAQARDIWNKEIKPRLQTEKKVALMYAANDNQANALFAYYKKQPDKAALKKIFRGGRGQAALFSELVDCIDEGNVDEASRFRILPIATSLRGGANDIGNHVSLEKLNAHLANIAWHIGNGWTIMGLSNARGFQIGGGASKNWYQTDPIFVYQSEPNSYALLGKQDTNAFPAGLIAIAILTMILLCMALAFPPLAALIAAPVLYYGGLLGIIFGAKAAAVVVGTIIMGALAAAGFSILAGVGSFLHGCFMTNPEVNATTLPRKISQGQYMQEQLQLLSEANVQDWPQHLRDAYFEEKSAPPTASTTQTVLQEILDPVQRFEQALRHKTARPRFKEANEDEAEDAVLLAERIVYHEGGATSSDENSPRESFVY